MQNSVNHRDFERTWHFQVSLGSMFLRVEFPPHLGGAPPAGARPEAASGAHSVARHWLKLGSAGRALRAPARRFIRPGWRSGGVASRWARAVPIGVLVASPRERRRSLMCVPLDLVPVWVHRRSLLRARVRLPAAPSLRGGEGALIARPASEPPPSNGARLPAELKHITKRRKRNQQGCP